MRQLRKASHSDTLWITDDVLATCDEGICKQVELKGKHCLFGIFAEFLTEMGFEMKCWQARKGTVDDGHEAQCYGMRHWEKVLD